MVAVSAHAVRDGRQDLQNRDGRKRQIAATRINLITKDINWC